MTNKKFHEIFGRKPRKPESSITKFDMDLASSVQAVTEEIMVKLSIWQKTYRGKKLVPCWGCSIKLLGNGKIVNKKFLILFGSNQLLVTQGALWELY